MRSDPALRIILAALRFDGDAAGLPIGVEDSTSAGAGMEVPAADVPAADASAELATLERTARFDAAFERTWSFAPEHVVAIAYGSYEPGELVIVEGDFDAPSVVRHVGERMNTIEISDQTPPRRVGFLGTARLDVAAVGPHRVAIGREHGAPMMRLLGRMRGRGVPTWLERAPESVRTRVAQAVGAIPAGAPSAHTSGATSPRAPLIAAFAMDGRFPLETDAGLVLARTHWAVFTLSTTDLGLRDPPADGRSVARLSLHGQLPPGAEENLRGLVRTVAESEYGGVFGMRAGIESLQFELRREDGRSAGAGAQSDQSDQSDQSEQAELRLELDTRQFAAGVALLLTAR